jgi:hypothetical protein
MFVVYLLMASLIVIPLVCLLLIFYLCDFSKAYSSGSGDGSGFVQVDLSIIEFLTQHKTKTKNYATAPKEYQYYQKNVVASKVENEVLLTYEFPLIKSKTGRVQLNLEPVEISRQVDEYGLPMHVVDKNEMGFSIAAGITEDDLRFHMNRNGWFYKNSDDFGVDYSHLYTKFQAISLKIAEQIVKQLSSTASDDYFNRVQSALNFVQYLPYGQPDFDTHEWYYFGLCLPPESVVLGYADCDSKSLLFASIIAHLIDKNNIIIVHCDVQSDSVASRGRHATVAVAGLNVFGEMIEYEGQQYLLLETTAPVEIGKFNWHSYDLVSLHKLAS